MSGSKAGDLVAGETAAQGGGRASHAGEESGPLVKLVQFPPIWGRNVSPFALKLETWLRLAGVPFEMRTSMNLVKAPKGKLPFIVDGGREIGDSTLIIEHLKATRGLDPDSGLGRRARAEALALQRLFEDHLYFIMIYSRWLDPEGWKVVSSAFFNPIAAPLRPFGRQLMRRRVTAVLQAQGLGRHRRDEIYGLARHDLNALADILNGRPFFAGDQLTTIDAVAYGFFANIFMVPIETDLKRLGLEFPTLVSWCETMEAGLYGEA